MVGTKRQAREVIALEAQRAGMPSSTSAGSAAC
jgi:ribosomal protein S2